MAPGKKAQEKMAQEKMAQGKNGTGNNATKCMIGKNGTSLFQLSTIITQTAEWVVVSVCWYQEEKIVVLSATVIASDDLHAGNRRQQ